MPPFRLWHARFPTWRKELVIFVGVALAGASFMVFTGGALGQSLLWPTTAEQAQTALNSTGLWPDPVGGVWYDIERHEFTVSLQRPLTPEETALLGSVLPKGFTVYRNYGPLDFPCDNADSPIKVWSGPAAGSDSDSMFSSEYRDILKLETFSNITGALQERYGDYQISVGYADVTPYRTDLFVVVFGDANLTPDDIEFVRSLFPSRLTVEIWGGVHDLIQVALLPPYIRILCG